MSKAILDNIENIPKSNNPKAITDHFNDNSLHSSTANVTQPSRAKPIPTPTREKLSTSGAPSSGRKPLATLPTSLRNQIQEKMNNGLQKTRESKSSRWMKPKSISPAKQDMQSVLERRLKEMRLKNNYIKLFTYVLTNFSMLLEISFVSMSKTQMKKLLMNLQLE